MGVGKPRGQRAGRKLKDHRRNNKLLLIYILCRWADKDYNKAMIGSRYRNPFGGASHAKGLVVEKIGVYIHIFIIANPNNPTQPCVNALEFYSKRMVRKYPPSFLKMVASII